MAAARRPAPASYIDKHYLVAVGYIKICAQHSKSVNDSNQLYYPFFCGTEGNIFETESHPDDVIRVISDRA